MKTRKVLWAAAALAFLGLACGEVPLSRALPDNIQKVYIEPFANRTSQPGVEQALSQKCNRVFIEDGRLSVSGLEQADVILKGDVQRYDRIALNYDANHVPQQYKLQVLVDIDFVERSTGKLLWSTRKAIDLTPGPETTPDTSFDSTNTRSLREFTQYYVINNVGVAPEDENTAQDRLLEQMARRVLRRVMEGF